MGVSEGEGDEIVDGRGDGSGGRTWVGGKVEGVGTWKGGFGKGRAEG